MMNSANKTKPRCPFCLCENVFVDIGVGWQQVTPYECAGCGSVEMSPYEAKDHATAEELKVRWWKAPHTLPSADEFWGDLEVKID